MGCFVADPLFAAGLAAWFRRPLRERNRILARDARSLRRELVHAAGCHLRYEPIVCASRQVDWSDVTYGRRVSVPRSLRPTLGRYLGAAR